MSPSPAILLDATAIPADRGGVGRYVEELARALAAAGARLTILTQAGQRAEFAALVPHATVVAAPGWIRRRAVRLLWEQLGLPRLARRLRAEVLLSPHYTMPLLTKLPVVVTLHDATFFSEPAAHSAVKRRFFRTWIRLSLRRAARCIAPTAAVVDELVRYVGADRATLTVAHHGVDTDRFHPPTPEQVAQFARSHDLDGGWIAFLGTLEPRKNVPALIRGCQRAMRERADPLTLVLAGGPGWDAEVEPALAAVADSARVIRVGYLPIDELPALLGGAMISVYPTLGEGFGLPVLEAMACGATVLTSTRPPMPEVGGDAVAYCEIDADSIGSAIGELLDDQGRRSELAAAGLARAAGFTWAASAATHLSVLTAAAAGR